MRGDAAPVNRLALERAWRGLTCSDMRILLFGLALLLAVPAQATSWTATYELRAAGLRALEAVFIFDIDGPAYTVEVRTRSLGVVGLFATSSQRTVVEGVWQGDQARPRRYRAQGTFRGQPRIVTLDWRPDGHPVVSALEPSNIVETREEVGSGLLPGTIDALTGLVQLSRVVARSGRCEAQTRLYDARRLTQVMVRTAGMEPVPEGLSAGAPALRCVIETRLLGGIRADQDQTRMREPVETIAWVGRAAADAPPLPFRIELASRWWGRLQATLVRMEPTVAATAR